MKKDEEPSAPGIEARVEEAETRTTQANTRTDEANTRTDKANTRTDEANTRTDEANTRTDEANTRTDEANTRTEDAEARNVEAVHAEIKERALAEEASARLAAIVNSSSDAIIGKDLNSSITSWNVGAERIFGYSANEMIGSPITRLIPLDRQQEEIEIIHRIKQGESVEHYETVRMAKDGRLIDISVTVSPIKDKTGKIVGASKVARDITERKRAEGAAAQLAALVNSSSDAIIGKDLNSIVTSWNIGAEKLLGYSANEMIGQPITKLIPSDRLEEETAIMDRIKHGRSVEHFETVRVAKDGRMIDISVTVSPIKDKTGKIVGAAKVFRDITERKRAEQEIHDLNVRLEQRVAERTAELETANKELEAFSYSVSHDLRSPLRAVDGFSQAVLEDYGPQLPDEGRRYLKTIREGAQRMGALIDDLLKFSRLSRAALKTQEVNTDNLVRHVLDELHSEQEGRQVEIRIGDLPPGQGDAALLKQVWVNLLSNALKYTRHCAQAVIEIGCKNEQGENVYFVRDNGAGFDMQYAHKLFGVFQRLHRAEEFEGTGVGLAIVQRVIHRHGGRIWVDAVVDGGATFYFTLKEKS